MKITPKNISSHYLNASEMNKPSLAHNSQKKIAKKFDELIINTSTAVNDEKFANDIASRISSEVRAATPSYKMDNLRTQIEEGTYQIGLDEIMKKIMLS